MTDPIKPSNSDAIDSLPPGPPGNMVADQDIGGENSSCKKKKSALEWLKKPPVILKVMLAILTIAVTAILIPYIQAIFSELRSFNRQSAEIVGQFKSFSKQLTELRDDIGRERKRVDDLSNNLVGVKTQIARAELQRPFTVALVSTNSDLDSKGHKVQKTHVIDAATRTVHTYIIPLTDDRNYEDDRIRLIGRAFGAKDMGCNSFRSLCERAKDTTCEFYLASFIDQSASFVFENITTSRVMNILPDYSPQPVTSKISLRTPNLMNLVEELNQNSLKYAVRERTDKDDTSSSLPPHDDKNARLKTLVRFAALLAEENQTNDAERLYNQSIVLARELGDVRSEHKALNDLGVMYTSEGDTDKAVDRFTRAFDVIASALSVSRNAQAANIKWDQFDTIWNSGFSPSERRMLELKRSAQKGDALAQYNLAVMYLQGIAVPKDYDKTVQWFTKAAMQNYAPAQAALANMYQYGWGVPKNDVKAVEWYTRAAERGFAQAQCDLGVIYFVGAGVAKDYTKARAWLEMGAQQDNACAQCNLGLMYNLGAGVPPDPVKAIELFTKAAERGNAMAQNNLGSCYLRGDGVEKNYDLALKWLGEAVKHGNPLAQESLAKMYRDGEGVRQDREKAITLLRMAAKQGLNEAHKALQEMGASTSN